MDASNALKIIEFANNLVLNKTGKYLKDIEQDVLQQVLEGKPLKNVRYGDYSNAYLQKFIARDLWKLLSQVTGKQICSRNVRHVLEKLQEQRSHSDATPPMQSQTNAWAALNAPASFNGSVSFLESREGQTTSEDPDSVKPDELTPSQSGLNDCINLNCTNRHNPNHLDSCPMCSSTWLLIDAQLPKSSEDDYLENIGAEDCSPNFSQPSSQASQPKNSEPNAESSTFSFSDFIKFIKPRVSLLLSVGILTSGFALSWLFNWYGVKNHLAGELPKAQFFYFWGEKLNPVSPANHFRQGVMYEDQGNDGKANAEYQRAIEGGNVEGYNNQARWYILESNYDKAVDLLRIGLPLAKDDDLKYTMLKNRGWARLGQGRHDDAKHDLEEAIQLKKQESAAYCLLAQVLEDEKDNKGAKVQWENCRKYAYKPQLPEEDKWIHLAQKRLDAKGSEK